MSTAPPVPAVAGTQASAVPAEFGPVLWRLARDSSSHFGCADARLEPLEYRDRPFSHVLRVAVYESGSSRPATHVFVKIFKTKSQDSELERMRHRVMKDFETTRRIHQALSASTDFGAVRPVACYPEHLAAGTEEVSGQTLLEYLHSQAAWAPRTSMLTRATQTMEKVGRWVRAFQAIDRQGDGVSIDGIRSYIDVRLQILTATPAATFGDADRARVLEHIERLYGEVASDDLIDTLIHADLAPANILISGERVVVLDFAMCGRGSMFHDLSRLFMQIDLLRFKPQFSRHAIDRLKGSLLCGFDPLLDPGRPMFRLLLLQHRINHYATLSRSQQRFPASLYNRFVRRHHRASLERELSRSSRVRVLQKDISQNCAPARILEVTSYPPPRAGWGMRVEFLKKRLEGEGHECVVLNIGTSRRIPSHEYETVMSGLDFVQKVWRYSRRGFTVHAHANGDSPTGLMLALTAELLNLASGRRCYLTFHAGVIQRHFPKDRNRLLAPAFRILFAIPRHIICNSDAVKSRIAEYGIDPGKITAIPAFSREYLEFTPTALPSALETFLRRWRTVVFTYVRMRSLFYPVTLIDGMGKVMATRPDVGLVLCGGLGHSDPGIWPAVQEAVQRNQLSDRICFVDDLDHDAFLTALQRSAVYVRTPITDGVASSVLEALALGVPVVACENGTRPSGVVTYPAEDPERLASAVMYVLDERFDGIAALSTDQIPDTVSDEVRLLTA